MRPVHSESTPRLATVVVDRPMGSLHPNHPDLVYPVNYGYLPGTMAADGEEQDAYVLGLDRPVERFSGEWIATIHRADDVEGKWVVVPQGMRFTAEQIMEAVRFQERFFDASVELQEGCEQRHASEGMRIAPVDAANLGQAAEVHAASWRASHAQICAPQFVAAHTAERQRAYIAGKMAAGSRFFLLTACVPVGVVSVRGGLIEDLYVHPAHQRRGYGTALLRHAIEQCDGTPTCWVLETNHVAERFYECAGFRASGAVNRGNGPLVEREFVLGR